MKEKEIPDNLKLYQDLPTEEREKRLDAAFTELNKNTTVCVLL